MIASGCLVADVDCGRCGRIPNSDVLKNGAGASRSTLLKAGRDLVEHVGCCTAVKAAEVALIKPVRDR